MKAREIFEVYENYCPKSLSLEGDVCGLQIGSMDQEINKVLVTLDIREQTVKEAIDLNVDCIVAKHAIIFRPLSELREDHPQEKLILDLIRAGISVYISHTNIDVVNPGLNDWFCQMLDIKNTQPLKLTDGDFGIGRVGEIESQSLGDFIAKTKKAFKLDSIRLISYNPDFDQKISRVAICGGSGGSFYKDALKAKADLYITGDIYYHTAQDMLSSGLIALDPGHYIESIFIKHIAEFFRSKISNVDFIESQVSTNPFKEI